MSKPKQGISSILLSIAEIVIGILLFINPVGFTSGIIVAFGILAAVAGVWRLIAYFRAKPEEAMQKRDLANGLTLLVIGMFCAFRSQWLIVTFPVITVLYGDATLILGINKAQTAVDLLRAKRRYWFVALIGAILTLVFALLILANPFTSTAFLWTFIAISLIVEAVLDILAFIFGRKSEQSM